MLTSKQIAETVLPACDKDKKCRLRMQKLEHRRGKVIKFLQDHGRGLNVNVYALRLNDAQITTLLKLAGISL